MGAVVGLLKGAVTGMELRDNWMHRSVHRGDGRMAFYQGVPAKCQFGIADLSCCCPHHDQEREALCQD